MDKKVKVGIIGAGSRAKFQTRAISESGVGEPFIVYSPFEQEAKIFAEKHYIRYTTCLDTILNDPDISAVTISTPNATHYPIAKKVLQSNKNVLVEYPPALRIQEIDELMDIAEKRKLVYWVSLTQLLENPHYTIKKNFSMIGKPVVSYYTYISSSIGGWYANPEISGPIYTWQHFHFVSQVLDLIENVEEVCAFENIKYNSDGKMTSTSATMLLKSRSGHISTIEFSMGNVNANEFKIKIAGENGIFYFDKSLYFFDKKTGQKQIELERSDIGIDTVNFLKETIKATTNLETARKAKTILNICLAADRSAKEKAVIKIHD